MSTFYQYRLFLREISIFIIDVLLVYTNQQSSMLLKSRQEQQYKYFYIDRKFSSGSLHEVSEALDEIDGLLPSMKKLDLINSLVMRMLDLMQHTKHFYLKHRVSTIFSHHHHILTQIHSKDQIAVILSKCLKASDQYTRIVSIETIKVLPKLFVKDAAVYHTLLSKVSSKTNFSKKQKQESIICLISLLLSSGHLSKLFTKNITDIQTLYKIPNQILIFILIHILVDSHSKRHILHEITMLIEQTQSKKQKKTQMYYFQKLIIKYALDNYHIVEYYQQKLRQKCPQIDSIIENIKKNRFPFLKGSQLKDNFVVDCNRIQDFIDLLYEVKINRNMLQQYQGQTQLLLKQSFINNTLLKRSIFLFYFLQRRFQIYEEQMLNSIPKIQVTKSFLKQTLVVGLFKVSNELIKVIELKQESYLLIKLYIQLKINDSIDSLQYWLQICSVLDSGVARLLDTWKVINEIFSVKQQSLFSTQMSQTQQQLIQLYRKLHISYQKAKQILKDGFCSELQVVSIILQNKKDNQQQIKLKCYNLLPSNIFSNTKFWFAYFSKPSILRLL